VIRIRIRQPVGMPKYYVVPGGTTMPQPLMLLQSTWPGIHPAVVITESELDALLVWQEVGDLVNVIALGSSSARPRDPAAHALLQAACWIGYALDGDAAGDKELTWWQQNFDTVHDIRLPGAKDPGEMASGGQSVRAWLTFRLPASHKPRDIRQHKFPEGTPEALRALHGLLSQLGPEVRIDLPNFRLVRFLSTGEAVLYEDPAQHHLLQRIYDLILDEPDVEAHFVGHPLRAVRGGVITLKEFI